MARSVLDFLEDYLSMRLPWWLSWWRIHLQCRRTGFSPWVRKIPWRRKFTGKLLQYSFQIIFPYRVLQTIENSFLCSTISPCWLSVLYVVMCVWVMMGNIVFSDFYTAFFRSQLFVATEWHNFMFLIVASNTLSIYYFSWNLAQVFPIWIRLWIIISLSRMTCAKLSIETFNVERFRFFR